MMRRAGPVLVAVLLVGLLLPPLAEQAQLRVGGYVGPLWSGGPAVPAFSPAPPPVGMALDFGQYPDSAAVVAFVRELREAYPHLVDVIELGSSHQGRPLLALRIGSRQGSHPDTRPALLIDGQHHAREPVGQQAVLYFVWHLVSTYGRDPLSTHLLDTRAVYAFPSVNPDGNDVFLHTHYAQRKNLRPMDDDGDGLIDEDYPQGLVGWSVYQVYEVTLRESWLARYPDDPFSGDWLARGCARRSYVGVYDAVSGELIPQVDLDGDGRVGEDLPGGVDLNRNYPMWWEHCVGDPASILYRGPEPFSEPETAALRDLMQAHPNIRAAITYHSGDDRLAMAGMPGGLPGIDEELYERIGRKASQLTESYGFVGTRHQHATGVSPGETHSWLYTHGVLAWLVEAYVRAGPVGWHWIDRAGGRAWTYYHTGLYFNPPPEELLAACRRWLGYNLYTLAAIPAPRPGEVHLDDETLTIEIHNDGLLAAPLTVSIAAGSEVLSTRRIDGLSAGGVSISLRLSSAVAKGLREGAPLGVTLEAGGPSRQYAAAPLLYAWQWVYDGHDLQGFTLLGGWTGPPAGEFVDIGAAFGPGGWDADPVRWDDDYYHYSRLGRQAILEE